MEALQKDAKRLQKMRERGEKFSFYFFGGHSMLYTNIDQMLEDLRHYESVEESINKRDSRQMNEIYRNLEIVRTTKSAWSQSQEYGRAQARARNRNKPHARQKLLAKLERGPEWKLDQYRKKRAKEAKAYRDKMTPTQKEAYKAAARKRYRRNK